MNKLLVLRKGANVITPHGIGKVTNFEVYPPLYAATSGTRQQWAGPDIVENFPSDTVDGSFIRIGVTGCHPTLEIAYYTVNELQAG